MVLGHVSSNVRDVVLADWATHFGLQRLFEASTDAREVRRRKEGKTRRTDKKYEGSVMSEDRRWCRD